MRFIGIKATRYNKRLMLVKYKKRSAVRLAPNNMEPSVAVITHNASATRRFKARGAANSCSAISNAAENSLVVAKNLAPRKTPRIKSKNRYVGNSSSAGAAKYSWA